MADDWLHITIEVPAEEGWALLQTLREKAGFREVDWCELQRPDFSRVSYGPCEPRRSSGLGFDMEQGSPGASHGE